MATLRPSIAEDDSYVQKLIKYIPAEIVTGYLALTGYLSLNDNSPIPSDYRIYYTVMLCVLATITPVWTYYAVMDTDSAQDPVKKKRAVFHSCISTLALLIWIYTIGNPILESLLCGCQNTTCDGCPWYSPIAGSMLLVLFTLLTPLFERIILGIKLPDS